MLKQEVIKKRLSSKSYIVGTAPVPAIPTAATERAGVSAAPIVTAVAPSQAAQAVPAPSLTTANEGSAEVLV